MSEVFAKNRVRLLELIYSTGSFTGEEIFDKYKKDREERGVRTTAFDGVKTVSNYLQELVGRGFLKYERGVCTVN